MEVIQGQGLKEDYDEEFERTRVIEDYVEEIIDQAITNITEDKEDNTANEEELEDMLGLKNNTAKEEKNIMGKE